MNVYVENNPEHNRWWVRLDDCRVSFTSSAEAEQFVERLLARLNAPPLVRQTGQLPPS